MRTIVDLPDEQVAALAELCARERISRAEAIRRAVAAMIAERRADRAEAILKRTFGAWKHLGIDTDTYLAELRAEWDREWVDGEWVYPGLPEEIDRKRSASAAAFGGWAHKKIDGLEYTEAVREEWDHPPRHDDAV